MKIVIDIPEEEYQNYLKMRPAYPEGAFCYIKAIQNGTPLPKGHGRLKDVDAIMRELSVVSSRPVKSQMYMIEQAPTIIEADKAESEE